MFAHNWRVDGPQICLLFEFARLGNPIEVLSEMAYRKRRFGRSRRARERPDWDDVRYRERKKVSAAYGGANDAARDLFLHLDPATLEKVFADYEHAYGAGGCNYARRTYA